MTWSVDGKEVVSVYGVNPLEDGQGVAYPVRVQTALYPRRSHSVRMDDENNPPTTNSIFKDMM